jgi:hypothetical protein
MSSTSQLLNPHGFLWVLQKSHSVFLPKDVLLTEPVSVTLNMNPKTQGVTWLLGTLPPVAAELAPKTPCMFI